MERSIEEVSGLRRIFEALIEGLPTQQILRKMELVRRLTLARPDDAAWRAFLAESMLDGRYGQERDLLAAYGLLTVAMKRTYPHAMALAARIFAEMDMAGRAFFYRHMAAQAGHELSYGALGVMYEYGIGVERDPRLAADWYQKALPHGLTAEIACRYAKMLALGEVVRSDCDMAQSVLLAAWSGKALTAATRGQIALHLAGVLGIRAAWETDAFPAAPGPHHDRSNLGTRGSQAMVWLERAARLGNDRALKLIHATQSFNACLTRPPAPRASSPCATSTSRSPTS